MDVAIGSLVTVICIIAAPYLLMQAGGWTSLHSALPPAYFTWLGNFRADSHGVEQPVAFGVIRAFEYLVPTLLLMLGNQVMYQKFFSAKSEKDAKISVVGWIVGTVVLETLIVAIAIFGRALYPTGEVAAHPREIIPYNGAARAPRRARRVAAGRGLRQGHLDRIELSLFSGHEPYQRRLCALHGAGSQRQARPDNLASCRGAAWLLGALPGRLRRKHSPENALGLHDLFRRADARGAGRVLFKSA